MNKARFVINRLRHDRAAHTALAAGAALAAAVLTGSLLAGSSVRESLRRHVRDRIGAIDAVVSRGGRLFPADAAERLERQSGAAAEPFLSLPVTARAPGSDAQAVHATLHGVGAGWSRIAGTATNRFDLAEGDALVNEALARQMNLNTSDEFIVRFDRPDSLPKDRIWSTADHPPVPLRLVVRGILSADELGGLDLRNQPRAARNIVVARGYLDTRLELSDLAARIAMRGTASNLEAAAASITTLPDLGYRLRFDADRGVFDLLARDVFVPDAVAAAVTKTVPRALPVFSYFVNRLERADRMIPYSFVSAPPPTGVSDDCPDDAIVLNEWAARELEAKAGDRVRLTYFILDPARRLIETNATFAVHAVVPLSGAAADPSLMPDIPGLTDEAACRDWDPSMPVDLSKIRPQDEEYWNQHKGTPKAFLSLKTAERLWAHPEGRRTSLRWPGRAEEQPDLERNLASQLTGIAPGFVVEPVQERARDALAQAQDIGGLFAGMSFFLVLASLILIGLLFAFHAESRSKENALLLAVGLAPRQVARLAWMEGGLVSGLGCAIGAAAGLGVNQLIVFALNGTWRGAVGGLTLQPSNEAVPVVAGFSIAWVCAMTALYAPVRRLRRVNPYSSGPSAPSHTSKHGRLVRAITLLSGAGALALMAAGFGGRPAAAAGLFFGSGFLGLLFGWGWLHRRLSDDGAAARAPSRTAKDFARQNLRRRPGRSLAVVALLSCGLFLVTTVSLNRTGALENPASVSSGTGGYRWIGESALPLRPDPAAPAGREKLGLAEADWAGASWASVWMRDGDDASCLNLTRAASPTVLGIPADAFQSRRPFRFTRFAPGLDPDRPWQALAERRADGRIPAFIDDTTLVWNLKMKLGDELVYVDERGATFTLWLAGALEPTIFQGGVLVADSVFREKFPSIPGPRRLLLDDARPLTDDRRQALDFALRDFGVEWARADNRLAEFQTVENTYLDIFLALGGLAWLVGGLGMTVVVLRNIQERRAELALLQALGFRRDLVNGILFREHLRLLGLGLVGGLLPVVPAVGPVAAIRLDVVAAQSLLFWLAALLSAAMAGIYLSIRLSMRMRAVDVLRNE